MKNICTYLFGFIYLVFTCYACTSNIDTKALEKHQAVKFSPLTFAKTDVPPVLKDSLSPTNNYIIGKFQFKTTSDEIIKLLNEFPSRPNFDKIPIEKAKGKYTSQLIVFVDSNNYIPFNSPWISSEKNLHRPVYIINKSNEKQYLHNKDQYLVAIQEALDSNGNWHAVELLNLGFCGNGYGYVPIQPNEFVFSAVPVYEGNFTTKLRYRVESKDTVLLSNTYTGRMNYDQFYFLWKKDKPFEIKGSAYDIKSKEAQAFFEEGFLGSPVKLKIIEP